MKFSFVIPSYNNYKLLHTLLWDIYKNCSLPYEVIVTDDGNDQETIDGLKWWADESKLLPVKHYRHKHNKGFLKNSNYGLQIAEGDWIALVSTDVRISGDVVKEQWADDDFVGGRVLDWDTGWNTFDGKVYPYLEGWYLSTWKSAWEDFGYFDERYAPFDMEDVDISTTARNAGFRLCTFQEFGKNYVSHIGAQSIGYSPEREELTKINREKFRKKWL